MFKQITVDLLNYIRTPDALGLGNTMTMNKTGEQGGYLDFLSGYDKYTNDQYRKVATHVFIVLNKQVLLDSSQNYIGYNGKYYKILYVDYPVMSNQTEIILKEENIE